MNFLAIRTEIITKFDISVDASVKKWVNLFESELWEAAPWRFKRVPAVVFDVTAGLSRCPMTSNGVAIADFENAIRVYDNFGNRLEPMSSDVFDDAYMPAIVQGVTGPPEAFKVENGVICLGPTPSASAKFNVPYTRKLSSLTSLGAVQLGPMTADTDTPIWDANHHMIHVWGGMRMGMRTESDLSYIGIDDLYSEAFSAMQEALTEDDGGMNREYGADQLGYGVNTLGNTIGG